MRFLLLLLLLVAPNSLFSQATDLFISEYIEGSGNVKYLEIFNGTGQSVDLSNYEVLLFSNGSSSQSDNSLTNLTGTLANGSVLVIANSNAEVVYSGEKINSTVTFFNGDDAVAIRKKSTNAFVDIFGRIGEDPGSAWNSNGLTTANKTLIRKPEVTSGVSINPANGFPTLGTEWIMFDQNDISNLGKHEFNAVQQPEGTTIIALDSTFSFSSTVDVISFTSGFTSLNNGLSVLRFVVHEDGFNSDGNDELPTILSQLGFTFTHFAENVDSIGVFSSTGLISSTVIQNSNVVTLALPDYSIVDNDSDTLTVNVLLKPIVKDNTSLGIQLTSAQVAANSSGFAKTESPWVQSPSTDKLVLDVTATEMRATPIETPIEVNTLFSITIFAVNDFGSIDTDYESVVGLSLGQGATADFTYENGSDYQQEITNGTSSWFLTYPVAEDFSVTIQNSLSSLSIELSFVPEKEDPVGQYERIAPGLLGSELIAYLRDKFQVTKPLGYTSARDHMYATIDNQTGTVRCVYTGYEIQVAKNLSTARNEAISKGVNTEHTWPQGLFNQNEPMRGDIHHLFPTREDVNGIRSNYPFGEIDDNQTTSWWRNETNQTSIPALDIRDEFSEYLKNTRFEPREDHKGNVARAIFYFWTIYGGRSEVADDATFFNGMKNDLLLWHRQDKPDIQEVKRSDTTAYYQGNRNPFIHDTTLVVRAYFPEQYIPVSTEEEIAQTPSEIILYQNYPNPFNPSTTISFSLPNSSPVTITVFDMLGRTVTILLNQTLASGTHTIPFNASDLSSGLYFYQFSTHTFSQTRSMLLLK